MFKKRREKRERKQRIKERNESIDFCEACKDNVRQGIPINIYNGNKLYCEHTKDKIDTVWKKRDIGASNVRKE